MSLSEKIYGGIGWVVGGAANVALKGVGFAIECAAKDSEEGKKKCQAWSEAGDFLHKGATSTGKFVGRGIATVANGAGQVGGFVAEGVANMAGADEATAKNWGKAGTVVASAAVGFVIGEVVTGATVGVIGVIDGLSGAAAVAHGERVIGSIIGGGQAVGKTIITSTEVASALSTSTKIKE